jgi:cell growth-regulating nucleolar protein
VCSGKAGPVAGQVEKLLAYPNIPRKKNKFVNFLNNCMAVRKPEDVERIWTVIVEANQRNDQQQQGNGTKLQSNGTKRQIPADEPKVQEKSDGNSKKRMLVETSEQIDDDAHPDTSDIPDDQNANVTDSLAADVTGSLQDERDDMNQSGEQKFSWKKTIKRLVRDSDEGQMHVKDLKRQVSRLIPPYLHPDFSFLFSALFSKILLT